MIYFKYTYYKESFWANFTECLALLLVVLGAAIGIFNINTIGFIPAVLIFFASFIIHLGVKVLASKINDFQIEKKISENASYAKYISVTYPDLTLKCIELNKEYAEYADEIPFEDFHPKRDKTNMIISIAGLSFLVLLVIGVFILGAYMDNL